MGDEFYKSLAFKPSLWVKEKDRGVPEKYIINRNAVVLIWKGGEKTVIKRREEDKFDAKLGFLVAFFQHYSGLSKHKANEYLANLEVQDIPSELEKDTSNKFKIGDTVEVVEGDDWSKRGWIGQIVDIDDTDDNAKVQFEVKYENGEKWNVTGKQIKLIRRAKANGKD